MTTASRAQVKTPWPRAIAIGVGLSLVVGVILLAFAWPSVTASARDLPVGIVGADAQVEQVEEAFAANSNGAVDLVRFDDRDEAVAAIEKREAYGAIVLPAEPTAAPEVLKATAASGQVAAVMDGISRQLRTQVNEKVLTQVESALQQGVPGITAIPRVTVEVVDLVPYADGDPQGVGLTVAMFPFVIGGMLGGILISTLVSGAIRRTVAIVVYAVVGGVVLAGILQGWFGALQGNYLLNAAAISLAIAAIATTITALGALFGRAGTAIGAASMMLVANPLSAASVPVQFLLEPWGAIGQMLPPGAAATLLRNLSYFPDASVSGQWTLLSVWVVVGLVLTAVVRPRKNTAE